MLTELLVRDLGVIPEARVLLGPGLNALTGETGAGKTLLVEAISLLVGGRADAALVRSGAREAVVEGRFVVGDDETVLGRVIPADGRSRAYVDGRLATAGELAERGRALVDLHGQHTHQSLLSGTTQRAALDRFGGVDHQPLVESRRRLRELDDLLAALGGDARTRARELDLLRYQVDELARARLGDADEDDRLAVEEDVLADAQAHREAAQGALAVLGDDGARDGLSAALGLLAGRRPFAALHERLTSVATELDDVDADLRDALDGLEEDPERLAAVQARRQLLHDLCRKYGETLADVLAYHDEATARLADLERHDERVAELERQRESGRRDELIAAAVVGAARREAAPQLARAVQGHLAELAMPRARVGVDVAGGDEGNEVTFLLGANPGDAALPLTKVASGGELARTMLALRLVLTEAPETLVFDEVDAGVGGEAALAVGRSLARLGVRHQVLVVTHLPQVAAFADRQFAVDKDVVDGRTRAAAREVVAEERIAELARMLSGLSESTSARRHAVELLERARAEVAYT
jgi:DNA repair protein RecN (Recombination protein N)